ncbi:MAG: hypothetical protein KKH72_05005 [Alphaproteobacteria bacterium]|nr:hypothetical protein [Alphaproteobacteria bacterium]
MFGKRTPRAVATGAALGIVLGLAGAAGATECGTDKTIDIAEMTWASAAALAHIHARILEDGYGCTVEIVTGDTVPTSASMLSKGTPAIAPELWTSAIQEQWKKGEADGVVGALGNAFKGGAVEAWFIPQYTKDEYPELESPEDVIARPDLFPDPENPDEGRLYACPPGWACEIANAALFEAYGMEDKGWNLFSPGSGGNLDASIARAFTREEPILFYYWGPTAILGKYPTYMLDMPEVDVAAYQCNTNRDCAEPPVVTGWPSSEVIVGAASWVAQDAPVVADYFSKVAMDVGQINAILAWGDDNKADAEDTAINFLKTEEATWTEWVPADVAEKVKVAL